MPLVRIDLHQGHAEEELAAIGDVVHRALVETIAVPADDRFQVITEHPSGRLIYDRHYLDVNRDDGIVLIQITLARGRPVGKKERRSTDESPTVSRSKPESRPATSS